jgi:hypothetical protein
MTDNGTQIIEAPRFTAQTAEQALAAEQPAEDEHPSDYAQSAPAEREAQAPQQTARAGSLDSTLTALTELVAQEYNKTVALDCKGMHLIPPRYQSTIKKVSIQLIRNAVMHGIETHAARVALGKPKHGALRLEFKAMPDSSFELHFEDDGCGLDPDKIRATAVARGLLPEADVARLRDREAIKLIFKSGYSTLSQAPGEPAHGGGMSLVRRYVHEAGGKIALASLLGHETRFKITLPPADADAAQSDAAPSDAQVA